MSGIQKLLDNRWVVTILRGVDGTYCAIARRPGQRIVDVIPKIKLVNNELECVDDGVPSQCAVGATPDEAFGQLVDSVFGLGKEVTP